MLHVPRKEEEAAISSREAAGVEWEGTGGAGREVKAAKHGTQKGEESRRRGETIGLPPPTLVQAHLPKKLCCPCELIRGCGKAACGCAHCCNLGMGNKTCTLSSTIGEKM